MIRRPRFSARLALCLGACAAAIPALILLGQGQEKPAAPVTAPGRARASPTDLVTTNWTGDFDGMVKRRMIRILTPYSKTHYFIDKGVPRGIVYDAGMKVEEDLNKQLKTTPATKIHVVVHPDLA